MLSTDKLQVVSLPNLAPGQQQLARQIQEAEAEQVLPETVSDFDHIDIFLYKDITARGS